MTDHGRDGIESELHRWLHAEGDDGPSPVLHARILAIPEGARAGRTWLHMGAAPAAAFTVAVAVIVTAVSLGFLTDGRFGFPGSVPDCRADPEAAMRRALEDLQNSEGYRWTEEEQMWDLQPPIDADNLRYEFSGFRASGTYLAPDRVHIVLDEADHDWPPTGPLGFAEIMHIGRVTWGYSPGGISDEHRSIEWQQLPMSIEAKGLTPLRFFGVGGWTDHGIEPTFAPGTELSWDLPGSGGCEVVREVIYPVPSSVTVELPPLIVGLRIDAEGRVVSGAVERVREHLEPAERRDDYRYRFEIIYDVPDPSEFVKPEGPIFTYPPNPSP